MTPSSWRPPLSTSQDIITDVVDGAYCQNGLLPDQGAKPLNNLSRSHSVSRGDRNRLSSPGPRAQTMPRAATQRLTGIGCRDWSWAMPAYAGTTSPLDIRL